MPAEDAKVKIELVTDDQSTATIKNVQGELKKTEEHAASAGKEMAAAGSKGTGAWAGVKNAIAGAGQAIMALPPHVMGVLAAVGALVEAFKLVKEFTTGGYEIMKEFASEAIHAASEMQKQEKAMAGAMLMIDRGTHSYKQLLGIAHDVTEEMEEAGLKAGVSNNEMSAVFSQLVQGGAVGSEAAKHLTEQMAMVGKITRGGMEGLAHGFVQIEHGMASARNPVVQLIATMGVLKGSAHDVASAMHKMTEAQKLKVAEEAIAKMADQMKKGGGGGPAGLSSLSKTFDGVREAFFESMGEPMLAKLLPPLNQVKNFLIHHIEEIKEYGASVGEAFGEGIEFLTGIFSGIYHAVSDNWEGIKYALAGAAEPFKYAFEFLIEHKQEIADTFKTIAEGLIHAFQYGVEVFQKINAAIESVVRLMPGVDSSAHVDTEKAEGELRKQAGRVDNQEAFNKALEKYEAALRAEGGATSEAAIAHQNLIEQLREEHFQAQAKSASLEDAAAKGDTSAIGLAFEQAAQSHNEGMMTYISQIVLRNQGLQQALVSGSMTMGAGFDEFIKILLEKSGEAGKHLATAMGVGAKGSVNPPASPTINQHFGGGIHIKQDFRDQDPDRIAFVFRRDLVKHSLAQTQASTVGRGGL